MWFFLLFFFELHFHYEKTETWYAALSKYVFGSDHCRITVFILG